MTPVSIPLSGPDITEEDIAAVTDVLRTPQLSLGPKIPEFEQAFASYVGTKHAIAVNSGTSALHLCIRALGIDEGDEVITTPFSFIASSNCILFERATPVFVDILPDTLCIDPARVEAAITPKTKAILAVDVFGYLADWDALSRIAQKHGLALIEDSCEALGSSRCGTMAGAFGDCAVFGFYPNKQMTTGEGGMVTTNRDDIADACRAMRNQGRNPKDTFLQHSQLGYNYRLPDINCALGIVQLKRFPTFLEKRSQVVQWYREALAPLSEHLISPPDQPGVDISWFVYVIRLADTYTAAHRDALMEFLRSRGIGCNNYFPPIHLQPFYRQRFGFKEGDFLLTEHVAARTIALPFRNNLTQEEIALVAGALQDGLASLSL